MSHRMRLCTSGASAGRDKKHRILKAASGGTAHSSGAIRCHPAAGHSTAPRAALRAALGGTEFTRCHPAPELPRLVLPLSAVVDDPEDAAHGLAFVHHRAPAIGIQGASATRSASHSTCSSVSRIIMQSYSRPHSRGHAGLRIVSTRNPPTV